MTTNATSSITAPESDLRGRSSKVRRIYLMRHGAVSYFDADGNPLSSTDAPLTERGRAQAAAVRDALAGVEFDKAVVSGLLRTVETCRIVLGDRKVPVEVREELQEMRKGDVTQFADHELDHAFKDAFRGPPDERAQFLGGESRGSLLDRVLPAVERLKEESGWETMLLVLHGGVNRAILSHALTGGRSFFGHFEQSPACVNVLELNPALEGEWVVRATNLKFYDPAHDETRNTSMEQMLWNYLPSRGKR